MGKKEFGLSQKGEPEACYKTIQRGSRQHTFSFDYLLKEKSDFYDMQLKLLLKKDVPDDSLWIVSGGSIVLEIQRVGSLLKLE